MNACSDSHWSAAVASRSATPSCSGTARSPAPSSAAVCDIVPDKARRIAAPFGVPAYADMHEMMPPRAASTCWSVLTESGRHAEHVLALAPLRQAHRGREADGAHARRRRRDDPRPATTPASSCSSSSRTASTCRSQKLREALEAGRFGKLVLGTVRVRWCRHAGLLRPGPVARHLGAGRRRAHQPGQPPRRPARVDDGRRGERVRA